jgi:hypothetical protein
VNIIGDKDQMKGRWKQYFEDMLNKNKTTATTTELE